MSHHDVMVGTRGCEWAVAGVWAGSEREGHRNLRRSLSGMLSVVMTDSISSRSPMCMYLMW